MAARWGLILNFENGNVSKHSLGEPNARLGGSVGAAFARKALPTFEQFQSGARDSRSKTAGGLESRDQGRPIGVSGVIYRGSLLDEAFNDGWAGKTLREVTPLSMQPLIISASEHCVSTGCAIYFGSSHQRWRRIRDRVGASSLALRQKRPRQDHRRVAAIEKSGKDDRTRHGRQGIRGPIGGPLYRRGYRPQASINPL